ncbi:MAG: Nif3-like dinuclear metal center hexameric protein [Lachnospiraceae bacterium]|nr:Nif3-like dinuclear metal center hexameric protein [Lachnospiraceae bacterium]
MKSQNLIELLEELSPLEYALEWDNCGLLCGRRDKEVNRVYIALDATDEVVNRAASMGADMLITHHPLIFKPVKRVNTDDFCGRRLIRLIKSDISYYAMHTNFDICGMADAAAESLGLRNTDILDVTFTKDGQREGIGRTGRLPRIMSLLECCEYVKERFSVEHVRIYGDPDTNLEFAAVCPGSGKSEIKKAISAGADVFITGDIEYHEGIDAIAAGIAIIDAGHYGIEKLFIDYMRDYISENCRELEIITHPLEEPFMII